MADFSKYLLNKLQEFEQGQGKRTSLDTFAEYLGVSRPLVSYWLGGKTKPSLENIRLLAERFGPEIYDVLELPRPDPDLTYIQGVWKTLPPSARQYIRDEVERYFAENVRRDHEEKTQQGSRSDDDRAAVGVSKPPTTDQDSV